MKLNNAMITNVRTASLGEFTVEAIKVAALKCFPDIKAAFAKSGGRSEGFSTSK